MEIFMQVMETNSTQNTKSITKALKNLGSNLDKKINAVHEKLSIKPEVATPGEIKRQTGTK